MYAGSITAADREEYLLGKPIDRAFLKQDDSKVRTSHMLHSPPRTDTDDVT